MISLSYEDSIEALEDLYHHPFLPARVAGLGRIEYLLEQLGNPQRSFRSVHVAGSSGKGSTTTMIGSILEAAGFRTGYFRSPHLHSYRERIALDNQPIDEEGWLRSFQRVWPVVEEMRGAGGRPHPLGRPVLFEVLFAMAAIAFREAGVEWVAAETGLGGRLDATNTLQSDVACITTISLEHTQVLGSTLAEIAAEKAGIIKSGCWAVSGVDSPEAEEVIRRHAAEMTVPLWELDREIEVQVLEQSEGGQTLRLDHDDVTLDVAVPLLGSFQARNAGVAFGAAMALCRRGVNLPDESVRAGLESVSMPGRLEVLSHEPLILLDGAHHAAAADGLARSMKQLFPGRKTITVFAAMSDKDVESMAAALASISDAVVLTHVPDTDRGAPVSRLAEAFRPYSIPVFTEPHADEAVLRARALTSQNHILLVTGSLYLVGHVRERLVRKEVTV